MEIDLKADFHHDTGVLPWRCKVANQDSPPLEELLAFMVTVLADLQEQPDSP
jgi:hypothetical protein